MCNFFPYFYQGNPPKHTVATVNVVLSNEASSGGPVFQTGQRSFTLSRSAAHVATLYARSNPVSSCLYERIIEEM